MAGNAVTSRTPLTVVFDTTVSDYVIGNAHTEVVGKFRIKSKKGGASPGSLVLKTRPTGTTYTGADCAQPIYYRDGSSTAIAGGTAISGTDDIYEVIVDGCDLLVDYTSSTHSLTVTFKPVVG